MLQRWGGSGRLPGKFWERGESAGKRLRLDPDPEDRREEADAGKGAMRGRDPAGGEREEMPMVDSTSSLGSSGRARSSCRRRFSLSPCPSPSLRSALRGLYALALLLSLAVAVLGALAFRKVDSISSRISSAQTFYEEKLLSLQEDLQGLGEKTSGNGSLCQDRDQLGRDISQLRAELEQLQQTLQGQEAQLDRTSQRHSRLSSAGAGLGARLESCAGSVRDLGRGAELLLARAGRCRDETSRLDAELRGLSRDGSRLEAALERLNSSAERGRERLREVRGGAAEAARALRDLGEERLERRRELGMLREGWERARGMLGSAQGEAGAAARGEGRNSQGMHELALRVVELQALLDNVSAALEEQQDNLGDARYHRGHAQNRTADGFRALESLLESHGEEIGTISANLEATGGHVLAMLRYLGSVRESCARRLRAHAREILRLNGSLGELQGSAGILRESFGILGARLDVGVRNLSLLLQEMRAVDARHGDVLRNVTLLREFPLLRDVACMAPV
ncbi:scavenger receptor class A member 3-like [Neopelma chrysocephalum]|uniref:scavenger receptor class A member 3-like n=1 Tax=Neopelma chrysocephalum TaxID=114329 RepID=UPI000FCD18F4|nr:scavenger receptor class A member 3-like [Neopelma chrysocephalum]